MWPLWWPKTRSSSTPSTAATITPAAVRAEEESIAGAATAAVSNKSLVPSLSTCHCCCLVTKLMKKLKRNGKALRPASRQSSFQCCYDPLSYSLNFDTSGCGSLLDEDYYKFYAFSSRFASNPNPRNSSSTCQLSMERN